jgi:hypothetical protein
VYALVLVGCGPVVHGGGEESTTKVDASSTTSSGETGTSTSSSTTSAESSTTGAIDPTTTDESPTSVGFLEQPDAGAAEWECDPWAQNCPPGEKCIAWADDGGGAWNSVRCVPVVDDPKQPGEPCTVIDSRTSGIDDCALGTMCWNVDHDTLIGECVELCGGSNASPVCSDPCDQCNIAYEGVVLVCAPPCDPVIQDCGEGEKCVGFAMGSIARLIRRTSRWPVSLAPCPGTARPACTASTPIDSRRARPNAAAPRSATRRQATAATNRVRSASPGPSMWNRSTPA